MTAGSSATRTRAAWARATLVLAAVLAADQVTKALVRDALAVGERRDLLGPLDLVRVNNDGIAFGGRIPYSRWSRVILDFLRDVSEPLLRPFRAILPTLGPLDLSPIVALIVLQLVGQIIVGLIRP